MRTPRLPVVDWTDAPVDLNGLVRFAERWNLVSVRVPSHFNWPLPVVRQNRACCYIYCFIYLFLPFSLPFLCTLLFVKCYVCDAVICSNTCGGILGERVICEYWCNDTDSGKPKNWIRNLSHYLFVQYKSRIQTGSVLPNDEKTVWPTNQPKEELTDGADLSEGTSRRPSVCLVISACTTSLVSVTRTLNYNWIALTLTSSHRVWRPRRVGKLRTYVQEAIGLYQGQTAWNTERPSYMFLLSLPVTVFISTILSLSKLYL